MTRDQLLKMYTDGKRDFYNADLSKADLRGADLSGSDFSGSDLRGSDLRGADLSDVNLSYANLLNANLSGAKYKDVVIKHVRVFTAIYRSQVWAIISEDDSEWIRIGCFFRKREEWNAEFWNNDNSEASNMRLAAFNFACKWIDERKNAQTKE